MSTYKTVIAVEDVAERRAQIKDIGKHSVPCPCQECINESEQKRCEPCRATGAIHCAYPNECGGPWDDRAD